jgi:aminopeptidase
MKALVMTLDPNALADHYAQLLIRIGVNLQPGQSLRIGGELAHADFIRRVAAQAYRAGARYVHVDWNDAPLARARLLHSTPDALDFLPAYEVARHQQMVDERWPRLALVGPEFPDLLNDVDPAAIRRTSDARMKALRFYLQAQMAHQIQWCVAAVPTPAWAQKVLPDLTPDQAIDRLWSVILQTVRANQPDPVAAWQAHTRTLQGITRFMARQGVRSLHFFDPTPGPDGQPSTDLQLGLTDSPVWVGASSHTPEGVEFLPNMPTEEIFCAPHNARTEGYVRTSRPCFPFEQRVEDAYFRFADGEVVEFHAAVGQEVLKQFFDIRGARRLGEVALVDVRSPVHQSGLTFFETLFDENAACHIAFGEAYPECIEGGNERSEEELAKLGINLADTHVDMMIGTPTMNVTGRCLDGRELPLMVKGQFTTEVMEGLPA